MELSRIENIFDKLRIKDAKIKALSLFNAIEFFNIKEEENILFLIANILHETSKLKIFEENLNYKTSKRLISVFPSVFRKKYNADEYINKPEKLADLVYNDNITFKNLGNKNQGDGWKYRGRGGIMLTGKFNYQELSNFTKIDFVSNPDLLLENQFLFFSACFFWKKNGIDKINNLIDTRKKVTGMKNPIGLEDVKNFYNLIKEIK